MGEPWIAQLDSSSPLFDDFCAGASSSESESANAKRSMNFFFCDSVHMCRTC